MRYWTIATDENNDIFVDGVGNVTMREDKNALANIVKNRQQTVLGELQYNTTAGIPYFTTVFCSPVDLRMFEKFMTDDAISTAGITKVSDFSATVNGDAVKFNMTLETEFGEVEVSNGR